jgi:hypothetical protein
MSTYHKKSGRLIQRFSFVDDKEIKKRKMTCISQVSSRCQREFSTTPDTRICAKCTICLFGESFRRARPTGEPR